MDIITDPHDFWDSITKCLSQTKDVNEQLVKFLKIVNDHVMIYIVKDEDYYRCGMIFVESLVFQKNEVFCIAKLLSLLKIEILETSFKLIVSYLLLLGSKNDIGMLSLIREYQGCIVVLHSVDKLFAKIVAVQDYNGEWELMNKTCTIQLDLVFQMCKYCSLDKEELECIEMFDVEYLLKSMVIEEDLFNLSKYRFILGINEQYMMQQSVENKVLKVLERGGTKFNECLLYYFNREEDVCLKIMNCKLIYLILIKDLDLFYHNDLNVLLDVLIRELNDLSEDEEFLRNTYLRVLFPLLNKPQFKTSLYKQEQLHQLLRYFAGQSEYKFWSQSETTKRLALKCLSIGWLTMETYNLENTSQSSLTSISKPRPPPRRR